MLRILPVERFHRIGEIRHNPRFNKVAVENVLNCRLAACKRTRVLQSPVGYCPDLPTWQTSCLNSRYYITVQGSRKLFQIAIGKGSFTARMVDERMSPPDRLDTTLQLP